MRELVTHFRPEEFACHDGTPYPGRWLPTRWTPLAAILEVIRGVVQQPIQITSGYRTEAYNRSIGGARFSQHVQGRAADITTPRMTAAVLHATILQLHTDGIIHLGGLGQYPRWVHIDTRPDTSRLIRWTGRRK